MRSDATRKGADCTGKTRGCELAGAADAELELDLLKHRSDLLYGLTDLRRIGLERACPEIQRLGLELDLGRVGRGVLRALLGHDRHSQKKGPLARASLSSRSLLGCDLPDRPGAGNLHERRVRRVYEPRARIGPARVAHRAIVHQVRGAVGPEAV